MIKMNIDVDIAIFIVFLIVNLVVGFSYSSGVKTIRDYSLGGRNFTTTALVATIVATFTTGGSFFTLISKTYSDGIPYIIANFGIVLGFFITGFFIVPRMSEFMGALSVAEVMGKLYGRHVRLITAVSAIAWNIGGIAIQFKVFGTLFYYFLGIPSEYAIILASAIVILYTSFGGIKAVTYTDVVQFFTFGFVLPIIAIIIWGDFQSLGLTLKQASQSRLFDYNTLFGMRGYQLADFILLVLYFSFPALGPIHFQRISMASSVYQARKAWIISSVIFVVIKLTIAWIPFLLITINPSLEPNQVVSYLIDNYTNLPLIKGLLIIGISAMAMSSADSFINGSAVLFAYDIKEVLKIKMDDMVLSKLFSLVLGVFAIYLALSTNDLLDMIMSAASFYIPVAMPPLLLAIFGFRSSAKSVLIAMATGFATVVLWKILNIKLQPIMIATFTNLVAFMASHYLLRQPGGWVGIKDREYLDYAKKIRKRRIAHFMTSVENFSFVEFCKKTAPKNELNYMYFGIYLIMYSLTTMYSTHEELLEGGKVILAIYQIMMVTGVVMAMYPIWPSRIKREIIMQISWNIIIFYMLVFFSAFFVMVTNFSQLQFAVFILNILIVAILTGWKLGISMVMMGFYLSSIFYKYYAGLESLDFTIGSAQFIFVYMVLFAGSALLIFFKPRQEMEKLKEEQNEHLSGRVGMQENELRESQALKSQFIRNISHEYNTPMTGISGMAQILVENYDNLTDVQRKQAAKTLLDSALRLKVFDANISTLSRLSAGSLDLTIEDIDLSDLAYDVIETCRRLYETNSVDRQWDVDIEDNIVLNIDKYYFKQCLENMVINAINYCPKGKIKVVLKKSKHGINFSITDDGIGIPRDELYDIFSEFTVSSKTYTPAGGRGVGLTLCKKVVELHGGTIKAESNGIKGAKFIVILPLELLVG